MRRYSAVRKQNLSKWTMAICFALVWVLGWVLFVGMSHDAPRGLRTVTPTLAAIGLDVDTLAPCPGEYGPAVRDPQAACVWDAATMGSNHVIQGAMARWLVYLPDCPVPTVQNRTMVICVPMDHWGE